MNGRTVIIIAICFICLVFLVCLVVAFLFGGTISADCFWTGWIEIQIVDSASVNGVEGVQVFLGNDLPSADNYVGLTDSNGYFAGQVKVRWGYRSSNLFFKNRGPILTLVKDTYCNDKQELVNFGGGTLTRKQTIVVYMKSLVRKGNDYSRTISHFEYKNDAEINKH